MIVKEIILKHYCISFCLRQKFLEFLLFPNLYPYVEILKMKQNFIIYCQYYIKIIRDVTQNLDHDDAVSIKETNEAQFNYIHYNFYHQ